MDSESDEEYKFESASENEEEYVDKDYVVPKSKARKKSSKKASSSDDDSVSSSDTKRKSRHSFSKQEEDRLVEGVTKFKKSDGGIDWKKVTAYVNPNLTLRQVFQRYYRVTLARKRHKWTDDQSLELYHYVQTREGLGGIISMSEISKTHYRSIFPDTQLRHHYDYHCKNNKNIVNRYKRISEKQLNKIIDKNTEEREKWEAPKIMDEPKRSKKTVSPKRKRVHAEPEAETPLVESKSSDCTVSSTLATVITEEPVIVVVPVVEQTIIYNRSFEPFKKRFKMAPMSAINDYPSSIVICTNL